jgi:TolB protein
MAESPGLRLLERKSGLIVFLGTDGNIYTIDQGGGHQEALTDDARGLDSQVGARRFYQFPAWSPGGRQLAFVGFDFQGEDLAAVQMYTANADGSDRVEAFRSEQDFPFYLYWSPDGRNLSFLTSPMNGEAMSLRMIPARGGEAQILGTGAPFYWSWSPDNRTILTHTGADLEEGKMSLLKLEEGVREQELPLQPGSFQTPAWSPQGDEFLLAGKNDEDGQDELLLLDRQGQVKKSLAQIAGTIAFAWAPDGSNLAYLATETPTAAGAGRELVVLDPERPEETKKAVDAFVVAFFWSPDSQKLAYFAPVLVAPQEGSAQPVLYMELHVMEARSGESQLITSFRPTDNFTNIMPNFDQYQRSATLWSPDSHNLVVPALDADDQPGIFVVEAAANLQPRYLAPGHMAFWSWK